MQLKEFWLIIWSWDLAFMGVFTRQVLSQKKNEGFCGSKGDDLFGLVCFFLLLTKFGGHVPRIFPPKNLSIAKFHEPYKYFNYIMWYKTMINVLKD